VREKYRSLAEKVWLISQTNPNEQDVYKVRRQWAAVSVGLRHGCKDDQNFQLRSDSQPCSSSSEMSSEESVSMSEECFLYH